MTVQFTTLASDFPPNVSNTRILQVVLYFSRVEGSTFEIAVNALQFAEGLRHVVSGRSGNHHQRHDQHSERQRG